MDHLITNIIKTKQTCIFISPHLDDAVLSAGGLIDILAKKTKVIVINVFTQASDKKQTLSAKAFSKGLGYSKPSELFSERIAEDKKALALVGITPINLGFHDVLWRKKTGILARISGTLLPELEHVYPTYRFHVAKGNIAKADYPTMTHITRRLQTIVAQENNPLIFCPLGVGNHVDHKIVSEICKQSFSQVVFWSDFPYNIRLNAFGEPPEGYKKVLFPVETERKKQLIQTYKSQVRGLFPNSHIPPHDELFFFKK